MRANVHWFEPGVTARRLAPPPSTSGSRDLARSGWDRNYAREPWESSIHADAGECPTGEIQVRTRNPFVVSFALTIALAAGLISLPPTSASAARSQDPGAILLASDRAMRSVASFHFVTVLNQRQVIQKNRVVVSIRERDEGDYSARMPGRQQTRSTIVSTNRVGSKQSVNTSRVVNIGIGHQSRSRINKGTWQCGPIPHKRSRLPEPFIELLSPKGPVTLVGRTSVGGVHVWKIRERLPRNGGTYTFFISPHTSRIAEIGFAQSARNNRISQVDAFIGYGRPVRIEFQGRC